MRRIAAAAALSLLFCAFAGVASAQAAPVARFTYSPAHRVILEPVDFDASSSTCDAAPCTYRWKDDGPDGAGGSQWQLGTGAELSFVFRHVGNKYVRLTVTNRRGSSSSTTRAISVAQTAPSQCADGEDNDGDALTDYPSDPGCANAQDDDESNVVNPPPPPPSGNAWPNPSNTGTPAGWTPSSTRPTSMTVTTPGSVIEDVRFTGGASLYVKANNVTIRRVEFQGGVVSNQNAGCFPGMRLEQVSFVAPNHATASFQEGALSYGGYSADRVKIVGRSEGFRVSSCGPVTITNSFAKLEPPEPCGDWHGDGLQGYDGEGVTVRNVVLDMSDHTTANGTSCYGTAPFFYPSGQGNQRPVNVDRLMVEGQGIPFRLGVEGSVTGLKIVDRSWVFRPIGVKCSVVSPWEAKIVTRDASYVPTDVRDQPCNTEEQG